MEITPAGLPVRSKRRDFDAVTFEGLKYESIFRCDESSTVALVFRFLGEGEGVRGGVRGGRDLNRGGFFAKGEEAVSGTGSRFISS